MKRRKNGNYKFMDSAEKNEATDNADEKAEGTENV